MHKAILFGILAVSVALLILRQHQVGGEYCKCDPTGLDAKRCPPVFCKKQGLSVHAYTVVNSAGTAGAPIGDYEIDEDINYNWGSGAVFRTGRADAVYLHFEGMLKSPVSGNVQFRTVSDDGSILKINGQNVVNAWRLQGPTATDSAPLTLEKDAYYPMDVLYYEWGGGAVLQLFWRYEGIDWQIVPRTAFFRKDPPNNSGWQQIPAVPNTVQVSSGPSWTWALDKDKNIYKCQNPCKGDWKKIDGLLTQTSVNDKEVWGVNHFGQIFHRPVNGEGSGWAMVPGWLKHISVSPSGWVWGVNGNGDIFICRSQGNCTGTDWAHVVGKLDTIDAADDVVVGVNGNKDMWTMAANGTGNWTQIPGKMNFVNVGRDWIYGSGLDGAVYRCKKPCSGNWERIDGKSLENLDVKEDSVIGVNKEGQIWQRPI